MSFTFGCPSAEVIAGLRAAGIEVWVTVTSPEEAGIAARAGADGLIVQGAEAGGHRGSFADRADLPSTGLIPLLDLVRAVSDLPLVATGGITTGRALAAVLAAGARAAQIGTAFLLAPEAGTAPAMRAAIATDRPTVLTRAFTGRLARGIRNAFIDEYGATAPIAYPEVHHLTAPIRAHARAAGDAERINLWAGEAHALARAEPAVEIVARLAEEAGAALAEAHSTAELGAHAAHATAGLDPHTAHVTAAFDAHAADYDASRRRLVPSFEPFYGTAVEAIGLTGLSPRRVLDLGAGTGLLSQFVRAAYPEAELTLLDGSAPMLDRARDALGEERVTYLHADLGDPLPAGPWDAIVSSLAIHHLADAAKRQLMARIHAALAPGGVFVNAEQVAGPTGRLTALYADWHERRARAAGSDDAEWSAALGRMRFDRHASVEDQLAWLRAAGFADADCVFRDPRFAVLVALKR